MSYIILSFMFVLSIVNNVNAVESIPQQQFTYVNLNTIITAIVAIMLGIISYFLRRTLKNIDVNQSLLFDRLRTLELHIHRLQTEHDIIICKNKSERRT